MKIFIFKSHFRIQIFKSSWSIFQLVSWNLIVITHSIRLWWFGYLRMEKNSSFELIMIKAIEPLERYKPCRILQFSFLYVLGVMEIRWWINHSNELTLIIEWSYLKWQMRCYWCRGHFLWVLLIPRSFSMSVIDAMSFSTSVIDVELFLTSVINVEVIYGKCIETDVIFDKCEWCRGLYWQVRKITVFPWVPTIDCAC